MEGIVAVMGLKEGFVEELCEKYAEYGISFDNWVLE